MAAIASRYARALVEVVVDLGIEPSQAVQQLNAIADLVESVPALRVVLQNPSVAKEQKLRLLDSIILRLGAPQALRNFVAVLMDNHRISQLPEIAEKFRHELNEHLGIAEVQVSSKRELTAQEKQLLEMQMAAITGKAIQATYSRDASLLGGATVRIGSTIYDGSVRGQLRKIKEQMAGS